MNLAVVMEGGVDRVSIRSRHSFRCVYSN
jgi:hypothetical protein